MRSGNLIFAVTLLLSACGHASPPPVDPAVAAQRRTDSVLAAHKDAAPALADEARRTMVQLLKNPASAIFDSLTVVQPALSDGTWPSPVVCARIGGKPGVKGATGMTPFIYRNPMTVFVLDHDNAKPFADLRAKYCGGPGSQILLTK